MLENHHPSTIDTTPSNRTPAPGFGMELGRFRLKSGVDEAQMRSAYAQVVTGHAAAQPGWRSQHLAKLQDGSFVDLLFAQDQASAQAICASWAGIAQCDRFLALIEPQSIEFGTLL